MAYRVEVSVTGRAVCSATHCKNEKIKIQKGEIRQGVLVETPNFSSMKWRHWGCITPFVIRNWKESSEGDMELVDGYDDLPAEFQEKVSRAFEQGHVDDEDWNGDPECNRFDPENKKAGMFIKDLPAAARIRLEEAKEEAENRAEGSSHTKPAIKRSRKQAEDDDGDAEAAPAAKKSRSKKAVKDEGAEADGSAPVVKAGPKAKKPRARKAKAEPVSDEADPEPIEEDPKPAAAKKSRATKKVPAKRKEASVEPDGDDHEAAAVKSQPKPKGRKKKAVAE